MAMNAIEGYFKSSVYKPFYILLGDDEYCKVKKDLEIAGNVDFIRLSSFCRNADKKPDMDKFREALRMADIDCKTNRIVVLGLGEYLALEGYDKANEILNELISFNLGSAHAVFLLRGVPNQINSLISDPRYKERQIYVCDDTVSELSFVFSSIDLNLYKDSGIKRALEIAEDGLEKIIKVNTNIIFNNSTYPIKILKNPYEALKKKVTNFTLSRNLGSDEYWEMLLNDVIKVSSLEAVFSLYGFDLDINEFYHRISGNNYENWLFYIFMICQKDKINNVYLKYVVEHSSNFDDFKTNILMTISKFNHLDKNFEALYKSRKKLVANYPEADIALFVSQNRFDADESVYKLTDNTLVEREEIITCIAKNGIPENIKDIYPDLDLYLNEYHFKGDTISNLLTDYFAKYKKQKIFNKLDNDFLDMVDEIALTRDYNILRTKDEIVSSIDKSSSYLCWIDALGVEYLSYIVGLAQRKGLSVSVSVGRSELPTLTKFNKKFYEEWPEDNKRKVEELDDIKHKEKGGYKYSPSSIYPIHLAEELEIISKVINEAATELALRNYDRYVIASDHGASRLAVLRKKEEKYDTDTQGEHSGRCCKRFENYNLPFATEENGYIVLADYGRFKGSRAANVEVHGGASLEEVVVPVITLSLKDSSIKINMVESSVKADYKTGIILTLYVNKPISQKLYLEYDGKRYEAIKDDENHYKVNVSSIRRACTATADVYLDENLISTIKIKAVGKSASMNSDFDDLF